MCFDIINTHYNRVVVNVTILRFNIVNRLPPVPRDTRVILSAFCNKAELLKQ